MIWQKLQDVLPLIGQGLMAVAHLPIPAVWDKATVKVVMTHHAMEILYVAPITVCGSLGLELVAQTAAFLLAFMIMQPILQASK